MVKEADLFGKKVYVCEACGFKYNESELASKCEDFCKTHNSCSMEITKHAIR